MSNICSQEPTCNIVIIRNVELEMGATEERDYTGIIVMEDKILVTGHRASNLQIYNRHDGRRMAVPYIFESHPTGVCILSETNVAVCMEVSTIVILSLELIHHVIPVVTFEIGAKFMCHSVAKWSTDTFLVSGSNAHMLCWCVVSLENGILGAPHYICEANGGGWTHVVVKDNTLYVSCRTVDFITKGVYAFNILNPQEKIFLYQPPELEHPWSIMVGRYCVHVCGMDSSTIHQITPSGRPVVTHTVISLIREIFYDHQHELLYTTSHGSNVITIYKMKCIIGKPREISSIQPMKFEQTIEKEYIYSIRVVVVGGKHVGKTTLVQRLLGENVTISDRNSTEGTDVHVNDCVLLSTREWMSRKKDSELQRLVKLWNESYQISGTTSDQKLEEIKSDKNQIDSVADDDMTSDIPYHQNVPPTAIRQEESPSTDVQRYHTPPCHAIQTQKMDPLREMIQLLNRKQYKAKQDVKEFARLSICNFTEQYEFYAANKMFVTTRDIYLLVADVSGYTKGTADDERNAQELVETLMNSIHSCAPSEKDVMNSKYSSTSSNTVIPPPVILVGTHVDQLPQINPHERGQEYLKEIRSYLGDKPVVLHLVDEDFTLDNSIVDSRLEDLRKKIIDVALHQLKLGDQISTTWFILEQQLMSLRDAGMKVIPRSVVEQINKEGNVQIKDDELDPFLKSLHATGTIIYISTEILRDNIILDPSWLSYALRTLINAQTNLPESPPESGSQSSSPTDKGSQLHISTDSAIRVKGSDFQQKGILSLELLDAIWTQDKHPDLHKHRKLLLETMEHFSIIVKPRSFSETGEKVENYYLAPCMLRREYPREVTSPEVDPRFVSSSVLCCVFKGKYLPPPIFHRLAAACLARWPVAKKKGTSEYLISFECCVFDIDIFHRLTLHVIKHIIYARITKMVIDKDKTVDGRLCTRVRRFITLNLSRITSYLGHNMQYELRIQNLPSQCMYEDPEIHLSPPCDMWFGDVNDPDLPFTDEHMNHARLAVALSTVCTKAMRDVLHSHVPNIYTDIYQAFLANKTILTGGQGKRRPLLNKDQQQLVFPQGQNANTKMFDISLLYTLIRNISSVQAPTTGWGKDPPDNPRDTSLGASMERIRLYRNQICKSAVGLISQQKFKESWEDIENVLRDIDASLNKQTYTQELMKHKKQVFSIFEAC